jgi:hypothetical protein
MMGWRDLVTDGMLVLVVAVVIGGGVSLVWFLYRKIVELVKDSGGGDE